MTPPLDPSLFDLDPELVWAMHCAEGPVPKESVAAARAFLDKELHPWDLGYEEWLATPDRARDEAARLLGAQADDFTITSSTSAGLSAVAQAFAWEPGDEVIVPLGEFPANVWPWKALAARQVRFREVPLWEGHRAGLEALATTPPAAPCDPEARLLAALGPRTRILSVSWVRFQDGLVLDLGRLAAGCAERGVALVVDGIQGAGTLPLDLTGVAAFATGVHKGLLAPQGLGLLWSSPRFRAQLAPVGSWLSVEGGADFSQPSTFLERPWLQSGRKLELGGYNGLSLSALRLSLALLADAGTAGIARHVRRLVGLLLERLQTTAAFGGEAARLAALLAHGRLGSILSLHHAGRGASWLAAVQQEGLRRRLFTTAREGYLRLALHGWHTERDVERIAAWLAQV